MKMARVTAAIDYSKVQPTWDQVLIKIEQPPKQTAGGIHLPDTWRDTEKHAVVAGRVIKQGPMAFVYNLNGSPERHAIEDGALVVFKPYAGDLHEVSTTGKRDEDDSPYRLLRSQDIIGVIEE
jgi:co-chaperonin GroES (HSP10)